MYPSNCHNDLYINWNLYHPTQLLSDALDLGRLLHSSLDKGTGIAIIVVKNIAFAYCQLEDVPGLYFTDI